MTPAKLAQLASALVAAIDDEPILSGLNGPDLVAVLTSAAGIYSALTVSQAQQRALAAALADALKPSDG